MKLATVNGTDFLCLLTLTLALICCGNLNLSPSMAPGAWKPETPELEMIRKMEQPTVPGINSRCELSFTEIYKHLCLSWGVSLSEVSRASTSWGPGFPRMRICFGMVSRVCVPREPGGSPSHSSFSVQLLPLPAFPPSYPNHIISFHSPALRKETQSFLLAADLCSHVSQRSPHRSSLCCPDWKPSHEHTLH